VFSEMEYPDWMMVAGAWLVVAGFIGLGFSRYMNRAPAEDNLHPEPPSNSSAYRNLEAAFWRSFCSSEQIRSSWPHGGIARITSVSASNAANSRPRDFGSSPDFLVQAGLSYSLERRTASALRQTGAEETDGKGEQHEAAHGTDCGPLKVHPKWRLELSALASPAVP
jgi:hypothetical protein